MAPTLFTQTVSDRSDMHLVPKMYAVYLENINFALPSVWVLPIYCSVVDGVCKKKLLVPLNKALLYILRGKRRRSA